MAQFSPTTAIQDSGIVICRSEKTNRDIDQAGMIGVLPSGSGAQRAAGRHPGRNVYPNQLLTYTTARNSAYIGDENA
jgi:hypothetical protein